MPITEIDECDPTETDHKSAIDQNAEAMAAESESLAAAAAAASASAALDAKGLNDCATNVSWCLTNAADVHKRLKTLLVDISGGKVYKYAEKGLEKINASVIAPHQVITSILSVFCH